MELRHISPARWKLRSVIRFCVCKSTAQVEIHSQLCEVYGQKCMSVQHVGKWRKKFNGGLTDVPNEQRSARPAVSDEASAKE